MKAALLHEYDQEMNVELKLKNVPEPTIASADEVIVRMGAATHATAAYRLMFD